MAYVLDANVFIEAQQRHYPMDVVPGFWAALLSLAKAGHVMSLDEVYRELQKGSTDILAEWAKAHREILFRSNEDQATQLAFGEIEERQPAYFDYAKNRFLDGADPWLISFCLAHGHTLVTHEVPARASQKFVKMPDICALVGVEHIRTVDMLRVLRVRLVQDVGLVEE